MSKMFAQLDFAAMKGYNCEARRGVREVYGGGLENRCPGSPGPWVRIPPPPLEKTHGIPPDWGLGDVPQKQILMSKLEILNKFKTQR